MVGTPSSTNVSWPGTGCGHKSMIGLGLSPAEPYPDQTTDRFQSRINVSAGSTVCKMNSGRPSSSKSCTSSTTVRESRCFFLITLRFWSNISIVWNLPDMARRRASGEEGTGANGSMNGTAFSRETPTSSCFMRALLFAPSKM